MTAKWRAAAALALVALATLKLWAWLALGVVLAVLADGFWLWTHPYGACGDLFHRSGGRNIGSGGAAYGKCPRCGGKDVPRRGAASVAKAIGPRYGRRYW